MNKYEVIIEHKIYKCTAKLDKIFNSYKEAEIEIKKHNDNNYNYYINKI